MRIVSFFNKASKWCQNGNVKNKNGKEVSLVVPYPSEEADILSVAAQMSLYGAITVFYPQYSDSRDSIVRKMKIAIQRHTGEPMTIAAFNDDPKTTFEDIQAVLKMTQALS